MRLRVLGSRVLIRADVETRTPNTTASGLVTAVSLAAAVDGSDEEDSWFVGTIVQVGAGVNREDPRRLVIRQLRAWLSQSTAWPSGAVRLLGRLQQDAPVAEPLDVGDRVVFSWSSGQRITIDGSRYLILSAREILGKLDGDGGPHG